MAAVRRGVGIDTTMGFTPAGGLMMGTRSGDLDPGVLVYLLVEKGRTPATVDYLVNQRSGLIGVSGTSSDVRDLLSRSPTTPTPRRRSISTATWRGSTSAPWRRCWAGWTPWSSPPESAPMPPRSARICQGMEFLGIRLDAERNAANAAVISATDSPATVRVMKTDEESIIARHTWKMLEKELEVRS